MTGGSASGRTRVLEQVVLWLAERDDRVIGFPRPVTGKRSDAGLLREAILALGGEPTGRTGLQLTNDLREVVSETTGTGMPPLLLLDDADVARLKARGYQFLSEEPGPGAHDCRVIFIHPKSCDGVLIELSQPPAGH